ncbi:MAG: arsenate reductase ArsC [Candidatus Kapabacteria bacterium]|nr:arsenate reductase ArsC [Candidatus Kapabacteria bacterium]
MNILFLCTGNSCRSQMAEAWARTLLPGHVHCFSAGVEVHGLNPFAIQVLMEAGIDTSPQRSKLVDELPVVSWDLVVTVCDSAQERCPILPGTFRRIHQSFDDPPRLSKGLSDEEALVVYRRVRDEIRQFVQSLDLSIERKAAE